MELGILKSVSPRQKWISEARDFTPWLAGNVEQLNAALGLELEIERTEVAVGPYAADILAKDTATGKYVIIENQLEKTDHDHLGKAITYASVLDVSAIVWIATDFTEEHKKALDWLNDRTTEEIAFYGVHLELWQIDDSKAALRFNVISAPSRIVRQAAKAKASDDLSESKAFQLSFWTRFAEKLLKTKELYNVQTPRAQYWFDVALGRSHIHISATCNTWENKVGVRIYIRHHIVDGILPYLETNKGEIEKAIGQTLSWNPNPDNQDKIIVLHHETDFKKPEKVEEALNWLVDYTLRFRRVFIPYVKSYVPTPPM